MSLLPDAAGRGLVADIGGTHARFALVTATGDRPDVSEPMVMDVAEFATIEAAAQAYLARVGRPPNLAAAVLACAGPIEAGAVRFVNSRWSTDEHTFSTDLGIPAVRLINDLAAVAWAVPLLRSDDLRPLGSALPERPGMAVAIAGVGTGFNAAAYLPTETGEVVVGGEYGHTGFAPAEAIELDIWRVLQARFGRVSIERVLSGPGLLNIYTALCELSRRPATAATPAAITAAAGSGDAEAARAVAGFGAVMGTAAGDIALAYGTTGGVLIAGGVAPPMLPMLERSPFRARFEAKGRMADRQRAIPTAVIVHPTPALLGAARAMLRLSCARAHPGRTPG